jgi:hypothetical protein
LTVPGYRKNGLAPSSLGQMVRDAGFEPLYALVLSPLSIGTYRY